MEKPAICVFCGSRSGSSPEFERLAAEVGKGLAERGATMIYGGGVLGLMGVVSNAMLDAGGHVTGIIPTFLRRVEVENYRMGRSIITASLFERKQAMMDLSDAFLALPGGLGTMDEVIEVITWRQLQQIDKPLVLLGESGFWDPFLAAIDHAIALGFALETAHSLYTLAATPAEAFAALGLGGG